MEKSKKKSSWDYLISNEEMFLGVAIGVLFVTVIVSLIMWYSLNELNASSKDLLNQLEQNYSQQK